jgi:hypothetical protein
MNKKSWKKHSKIYRENNQIDYIKSKIRSIEGFTYEHHCHWLWNDG